MGRFQAPLFCCVVTSEIWTYLDSRLSGTGWSSDVSP